MKLLFVAVFAVVLGACADTTNTSESEFNRLAAQAENEIRIADRTGFLWRDTERILDDARQAIKQGREDEALKLARKALLQAQLAQQQAKDNVNAAPTYPVNP